MLFCIATINCYASSIHEKNQNFQGGPVVCAGINDDNKTERLIIGNRFVINGKPYEFAEHWENDDFMMMRSEKIDGQPKYYFYLYDVKKNNSFLFIKNDKHQTLRGTKFICVPYHVHI